MLQAKGEVQKLIVKAQDGALEAQPGRTIMESFEGQVTSQSPAAEVQPERMPSPVSAATYHG